jgi:hypothetical protein
MVPQEAFISLDPALGTVLLGTWRKESRALPKHRWEDNIKIELK